MDRDEKERFFANSGMPRLKTLTGKNIALFGLSANPPTGYQGYIIELTCIFMPAYFYVCMCILLNELIKKSVSLWTEQDIAVLYDIWKTKTSFQRYGSSQFINTCSLLRKGWYPLSTEWLCANCVWRFQSPYIEVIYSLIRYLKHINNT